MKKKSFNILTEGFIIIFIAELILGFNGKLLMVGNVPIREVIFGLLLLGLIIKLFTVIKNNEYNEKEVYTYEESNL